MKRFLSSLFLLSLTLPLTLSAQNNTTVFRVAYTYENLTVDNTAGGVPFTSTKVTSTTNIINSAQLITFTIDCASGTTCPIRMMVDGATTVTTSVGFRADYQQSISLFGHDNIVRFRAIREGATSAILNVTYWR